jgi:hypothetical protein
VVEKGESLKKLTKQEIYVRSNNVDSIMPID